jgi:hypothetical protein
MLLPLPLPLVTLSVAFSSDWVLYVVDNDVAAVVDEDEWNGV